MTCQGNHGEPSVTYIFTWHANVTMEHTVSPIALYDMLMQLSGIAVGSLDLNFHTSYLETVV